MLHYTDMNEGPGNRELDKRIELLKKDYQIMKTDMNATLKEMQADAAKRDKTLIITIVGLLTAGISILVWLD